LLPVAVVVDDHDVDVVSDRFLGRFNLRRCSLQRLLMLFTQPRHVTGRGRWNTDQDLAFCRYGNQCCTCDDGYTQGCPAIHGANLP